MIWLLDSSFPLCWLLYDKIYTFHAGCAFINVVLPYLLDIADFDLSINAYSVILNPFEFNPVIFLPKLSLLNIYLVKFVYPFPCTLYDRYDGMKPW